MFNYFEAIVDSAPKVIYTFSIGVRHQKTRSYLQVFRP